ncbi:MAG: aldo/keto reductase [Bifidobacteriaceae bacterium]|jgi:2,5-diketo-D-gluconate reductase A|nr:aldo/keto reductase [Bifidobacteriaceae bacterium]
MTVPNVVLNDSHELPMLGLGTWPLTNAEAAQVVAQGLAAGYRLVDTATRYANEVGIGQALAGCGLPREAFKVTSKIRGGDQESAQLTRRAVDQSLTALGVTWLDLELIHWPLPMLDRNVATFTVLAELQREGLIKSIGVSNFLPSQLDRLIAETGIIPAVNQIELNPYHSQVELRQYHQAKGIVTQAWAPLGHGRSNLLNDPVVTGIAQAVGASTAQVVLAWHRQHNIVAIPKSADQQRQQQNLASVAVVLTAEQLALLDGLDRGLSIMPESSATHDER